MYFPYLRGRQFELLAIKELLEKGCISKNIIPVIEPIKLSSTLTKTMEIFAERGRLLAIVHNPQVGSFSDELEDIEKDKVKNKYVELMENKLIIKSHILNNNSNEELRQLYNQGIEKKDLLVIINNRDYLNVYSSEFSNDTPKYNLIPDERIYRKQIGNRVLINDKFIKQERNVDYSYMTEEFFSDDHLCYHEEGYQGFSDFSIVGDVFSESGYAPYAVTIHIVYFDVEKNMRIKHFVSNSNEDIKDPAKKFYEALTKLAQWQKEVKLDTYAISKFMEHFNNQTYPGLGIVKKLSIMHHIELISRFLDEVN